MFPLEPSLLLTFYASYAFDEKGWCVLIRRKITKKYVNARKMQPAWIPLQSFVVIAMMIYMFVVSVGFITDYKYFARAKQLQFIPID